MNILITAPSLDVEKNVSGISSVVKTIITNNKQHNYIHFIAGREDKERGIAQRLVSLLKGYASLYKTLKHNNIELVHLNLAMNPKSIYRDYIVFRVAHMLNKKIVVHLHGGKYLLLPPANKTLKRIIKNMLLEAAAIVCLSDMEKTILEQNYSLTGLRVIANTVDDSYLHLGKTERINESCTVLFLGRLHESKGITVILQAVKKIMQQGNTALNFIFCGTGPLEEEVLSIAKLYPEFVKFYGPVSGKTKEDILASADIFLLPSLHGEGLPMSLIEAMACGLVPIVTDDGSMKTFVCNNKTGIKVNKNNVAELVHALTELSGDTEKMCKISTNAKEHILSNCSVINYINLLNDMYLNAAY